MKRRVCVVAASEMTVKTFLAPHLRAMQSEYDVTLVVNTSNHHLLTDLGVEGHLAAVRIERPISPWRDAAALCALYRLIRRQRFDIVHSFTPKAGLLAMAAAWLARTPIRIHTFTGQVWATRRGLVRSILRALDAAIARMATITIADSASQRDVLIREGVLSGESSTVLEKGSVSGVDTRTFRPDPEARAAVRARLNIPAADQVLLFVGRLTIDKGVHDLASAFHTIACGRRDVRLIFVGPDEAGQHSAIAAACAPYANRVHFLEFTDRPQDVMAASDVLCLPSYREGFGTVVIEAAACALPAVASQIYGIVDAVENGRTGLLHAPGDVLALVEQLHRLVADPDLRRSLGAAARERVARDFRVDRLTAALLSLYSRLLGAPPSVRLKPNTTYGTWCPPSGGPNDAAAVWYRRFGKRALDVALTAFALVLLSPLCAVLAILVRATLGSPVLFRQKRPGLHGVPFVLVKFRSMTDRYDEAGRRLPDEQRLTAVGRFLRTTSLDELPELWNVLVGDMSVVGPRPLLMEYLPRYSARHAARHAVRPGITGLAQVNGRNDLAWEERFELDLRYAERVSLAVDLRILARTVWLVIGRRGISQPGHATAEEFSGVESQ